MNFFARLSTLTLFSRLSLSYFFYFSLLGLVSTFLSVFLDGKGFTSREIGEILAIFTVTKIIAPSLWSMLADKTGQQILIIRVGALLALLCFSSLFWLSTYGTIALALASFSLFWTAILPQLEVHTLTKLRKNAKIYARVRLWGSIGFIVLAVITGHAIGYFSNQAFVILGALMLLALFICTLALNNNKRKRVNSESSELMNVAIWNKIINANFIVFFLAGVLLQMSFAPYYGFFALFLRELNYPDFSIGLFVSLGVIAEIVAFIYMGRIFKHCSLKLLLTFSLGVTALRWFLLPLIGANPYLLAITQLSHAASFAIYHSASMAFISNHFTQRQQSRGQGIYVGGVYGIGGATGAYITGILWLDGAGVNAAFAFAAACALLGTLIMLRLKPKIT
ncbi:MFS transporter [Colwellia sp. D2M02]|nr:MFS transporter [Colwellia sp. D2M02]